MKSLSSLVKKPTASILLVSTLAAASLSPAANAADLGVLKTGERLLRVVCHTVKVIDKGVVAVIGATSDKVIKRMESLIEDDNERDLEEKLDSEGIERAESWAPPHMFKY